MSSEILAATLEYPALAPRRRRPRVLVVDSDPHVVDYLRHFLGEAGYAVFDAPPGPDALTAVRRTDPSLVIAEILAPVMDGFSLCRALKASSDGIRVILFSSLAARDRAREAGADAFLVKPISERHLLSTVGGVLHTPRPAGARIPADC